jgi:cellulose synthase/poly-beta-1,6-N-acetylglucosamine synthase-like glycosyltransferase
MMPAATLAWWALTVVAVMLALPAAVLLAQVLLACLPQRPPPASSRRPRIAVLIPAHNESAGVVPTIRQVQAQLVAGDRLLVVADNCSDDTAAYAAAAGAEVSVRHDPQRRGKGFALDHGVRHLTVSAPEVVVVVDADCEVGPGCLARIAGLAADHGRVVQGRYLMRAAHGGLKQRIAAFAMRVKNHVRPRGLQRLGLGCGLMGSGMALPWSVAATAPLASGHLAEDLQLGIALTEAGRPPLFCEDACVASVFAASADGERSQRTRWEHGHLGVLLKDGPRLLWRSLRLRRWAGVAMAADLMVPPLALLLVLQMAVLGVGVVAWAAVGWWAPALAGGVGLLALGVAVLTARQRFATDLIGLADLLRAPCYALAKLPMYLRFVWARQVDWVRTKRDLP